MKKIIVTAIIALAGIGFFEASNAGPFYLGDQPGINKNVRDTVPGQRRDTSWNKKKYPDTTHMPKRDSARTH